MGKKGGDENGIHVVAWTCITEGKTVCWSLGIRNLALAKHSLTAKIIFKYLDIDDAIWDRPCPF